MERREKRKKSIFITQETDVRSRQRAARLARGRRQCRGGTALGLRQEGMARARRRAQMSARLRRAGRAACARARRGREQGRSASAGAARQGARARAAAPGRLCARGWEEASGEREAGGERIEREREGWEAAAATGLCQGARAVCGVRVWGLGPQVGRLVMI
jgi:hypothetical protein